MNCVTNTSNSNGCLSRIVISLKSATSGHDVDLNLARGSRLISLGGIVGSVEPTESEVDKSRSGEQELLNRFSYIR